MDVEELMERLRGYAQTWLRVSCGNVRIHGVDGLWLTTDDLLQAAEALQSLAAENARLTALVQAQGEALKRIATVDMGGGFLGAQACRQVASAPSKEPPPMTEQIEKLAKGGVACLACLSLVGCVVSAKRPLWECKTIDDTTVFIADSADPATFGGKDQNGWEWPSGKIKVCRQVALRAHIAKENGHD